MKQFTDWIADESGCVWATAPSGWRYMIGRFSDTADHFDSSASSQAFTSGSEIAKMVCELVNAKQQVQHS